MLLVGAVMTTAGCSEDETAPDEPPCAEGSGDVELCARVAGAEGAAETVVLLPTGPGIGSSYLHSLADTLADVDLAAEQGITLPPLRVLTYDPRGTGSTNAPSPPSYTIADYAEDLEAVRNKAGAGPIHIVAQGWSALVAYHYLRLHPQNVRSLTLVGGLTPRVGPNEAAQAKVDERIEHVQAQGHIPNPLPPDEGDDCNPSFVATLPAFLFYWQDDPSAELASASCSVSVRAQTQGTIKDIPYDYAGETAAFAGPALVIEGQGDPFDLGNTVLSSLASSAPEFIVVPNGGHYPWLDAQVELLKVERDIWTFLAAAL